MGIERRTMLYPLWFLIVTWNLNKCRQYRKFKIPRSIVLRELFSLGYTNISSWVVLTEHSNWSVWHLTPCAIHPLVPRRVTLFKALLDLTLPFLKTPHWFSNCHHMKPKSLSKYCSKLCQPWWLMTASICYPSCHFIVFKVECVNLLHLKN